MNDSCMGGGVRLMAPPTPSAWAPVRAAPVEAAAQPPHPTRRPFEPGAAVVVRRFGRGVVKDCNAQAVAIEFEDRGLREINPAFVAVATSRRGSRPARDASSNALSQIPNGRRWRFTVARQLAHPLDQRRPPQARLLALPAEQCGRRRNASTPMRPPRLRPVLFLEVVLDVFGQHIDLGVVHLAFGFDAFDLAEQYLHRRLFHDGLGNQLLVLQRCLYGRVEDFLFDLGMDGQFEADLLDQCFFLAAERVCSYSVNRPSTALWSAFNRAIVSWGLVALGLRVALRVVVSISQLRSDECRIPRRLNRRSQLLQALSAVMGK